MEKELVAIFKVFADEKKTWITGDELVKKLDAQGYHMNRKTIFSYIRAINSLFHEAIGEDMIISRRHCGWSLAHGYFNDGQLQLLSDAISYNKDLSYNEKMELMRKLMYFSSRDQREHLKPHLEKDEKPFSLMVNLSVIMKAIREQKNIIFEYVNYAIDEHRHPFEVASEHGNAGKNYVVSPYTIVLDNNHYYLIGYFSKRQDVLSMYRVDRMRKVLTYKGSYVDIRDSIDMNEYIRTSFNMFVGGEETDIILHFHQNILREVVSRFGEDIVISRLNGSWFEAIIRHQSYSKGLISWIMMLGSQIEVVAPRRMRDEISAELEKTMARYKK